MASMQDNKAELRRQRLLEFFKDHPRVWEDCKDELVEAFNHTVNILLVMGPPMSAEYLRGKAAAYKEIINMESLLNEIVPTK